MVKAFFEERIVLGKERCLFQTGKNEPDKEGQEAKEGAQFQQTGDGEPGNEGRTVMAGFTGGMSFLMGQSFVGGMVYTGFDHLEEVQEATKENYKGGEE